MAPAKNNPSHLATYGYGVQFLLSMAIFSVVSATDSSLCTLPSPAPNDVPTGKDTPPLIDSFRLSAGYFFGGEDIHFAKDESDDDSVFHVPRSFTLLPLQVHATTNSDIVHVSATLTLSGGRDHSATAGRRRRNSFVGSSHAVVSFHLEGYYSSTSAELCLVGSGTYTTDEGWLQHHPDVVLRLRVPSPPSLSDPFVTGRLKGAGFEAISLVAYAESDGYKYGRPASCPPLQPPSSPTSGALQALGGGANFSCAHLKEQLVSSYKLQYGGSVSSSSTSPALLRLREPRMHVGQAQCTADGAVRVYATFSNNTNMWDARHQRRPGFVVKEEAVVGEGRWDSTLGMLCLRACRVVRSRPTMSLAVQEQGCGIGISFWFPAVWTIRDRSIVAGRLWNSSRGTTAGSNAAAAAVSASSIDVDDNRGDFSGVKYAYTMVEEAKERYFTDVLRSRNRKKSKGPFPAAKYTYHDFEFHFYMDNNKGPSSTTTSGHGEARPVTIGSAMVNGDRLAAGDAELDMEHGLLNVSYDILTRHLPPHVNLMRAQNATSPVTIEERLVTAEGVYDPATGVLCMIGCQELHGSTDCQVLVTVHFASLDSKAQGHGRGVISSLRAKNDPLFFNKTDIVLFGMYTEQVSESIARMDLESVLLVVSTTLPCVFTAAQILHAKRNPEASAATSVTMLVVLALGYVAPLVVSSEALFVSRGTEYAPFQRKVPYEPKQAMLRVPTLVAFVLQLRLLQLSWSGRRSSAGDRNRAEMSAAAAERRALWVCLPLYLLGGALTIALHVSNSRRAAREDSLAVRVGPEPATLWEDLASSAGLALDGFLLPQVAMNALSGSRVRAISPWFYVGGTVARAMPRAYDVVRSQGYAPSMRPSNVYASPLDDRFGVAWDIAVPCGAALLAVLLFLQQRLGGAALFRSRRTGAYEMVSATF